MLSATEVKTCRDLAWDFALTSRMNAFYYQRKVSRWKQANTALQLVAAIAASATIAGFLREHPVAGTNWAAVLAVLSAGASIVGATMQIPERVRAYGVLLSEYTAHAGAFERLFQFGCTEDSVSAAIAKFEETEQREAKEDPAPDKKLLAECQTAVFERIGARET